MKILVFGSDGQVGRELRVQLPRLRRGAEQPVNVVFSSRYDLDLGNSDLLLEYLEQTRPNIIVNASAYTAVDQAESQSDLAFSINEGAVKQMARYCNSKQSPLIHISTDYVFSGEINRPYTELDEVCPSGVYGRSKLAGEIAITDALEKHIIIRTSWVFGANGGNFVKTMLKLAEIKNELSIVADQCGAPTSARGIAESIANIINQLFVDDEKESLWGTYHYSGAPHVSWAEFAREIFQQAKQLGIISSAPIVKAISTEQYPTPATRPQNSRLECSKITKVFGIEPDNWRAALSEMLDEIRREESK